jgi:chromosome transmission fidelity protein 18
MRDGVDVFDPKGKPQLFNNRPSNFKNRPVPSEAADPLKRPRQKILLLSGPPGLGKTTLAHVIANHCGYRCLEINASDDRTVGTLMPKLVNALESMSVIRDKRPTLIVIDEIDGASQAASQETSFISFLINLAADKAREVRKNGTHRWESKPRNYAFAKTNYMYM